MSVPPDQFQQPQGLQPDAELVRRDPPDVEQPRSALVEQWAKRVRVDKAHHHKPFERMREDMKFAAGEQWPTESTGYYVANITARHIAQRVASLYAKNPKVAHRLHERMDYTVWDGDASSLKEAEELNTLTLQATNQNDPNAMAVLEDYAKYQQRRAMLRRTGKTMELLFQHFAREQVIPFKANMKAMVRRVVTTGVGYVGLDFQRVMALRPETEQRIGDMAERLAFLERLAADMSDDIIQPQSPEAEQLRLGMQALEGEQEVLVREGLVFEFPQATSIIPHYRCRSLNGFVGADWVTREYVMDTGEIQEIYDVDVGSKYKQYKQRQSGRFDLMELPGDGPRSETQPSRGQALLWEIYSRKDGLVYTLVDGYPDFLQEPSVPNVQLERFYPFFSLQFNEQESEDQIFPYSDVRQLRDMQLDYNRARQGLREHRRANRPKTITSAGALSKADRDKLETHPPNAVIELQALLPGQDVEKLLQPMRMPGIDPAVYDTNPHFDDILKVVGVQEAVIGGTSSRTTATETSVAESARVTTVVSAIDELDELLNTLAMESGKIMLIEMDEQTVRNIVGAGARWPKLSRGEINSELYLTVEAGSTGKPNQTQEIQNAERIVPFLLQIPGIKPEFLAQQMLRRLDDKLELSEALQLGMSSIVAANAVAQAQPPGDASTAPAAQGAQGASNAPQPGGVPGNTATGPPAAPSQGDVLL